MHQYSSTAPSSSTAAPSSSTAAPACVSPSMWQMGVRKVNTICKARAVTAHQGAAAQACSHKSIRQQSVQQGEVRVNAPINGSGPTNGSLDSTTPTTNSVATTTAPTATRLLIAAAAAPQACLKQFLSRCLLRSCSSFANQARATCTAQHGTVLHIAARQSTARHRKGMARWGKRPH